MKTKDLHKKMLASLTSGIGEIENLFKGERGSFSFGEEGWGGNRSITIFVRIDDRKGRNPHYGLMGSARTMIMQSQRFEDLSHVKGRHLREAGSGLIDFLTDMPAYHSDMMTFHGIMCAQEKKICGDEKLTDDQKEHIVKITKMADSSKMLFEPLGLVPVVEHLLRINPHIDFFTVGRQGFHAFIDFYTHKTFDHYQCYRLYWSCNVDLLSKPASNPFEPRSGLYQDRKWLSHRTRIRSRALSRERLVAKSHLAFMMASAVAFGDQDENERSS